MRVGIISDTHDQVDRTRHAVEMLDHAGADAYFHCGDFIDASILKLLRDKPCFFVFGNNDSDSIPGLRKAASAADVVCLEWGGIVTLDGKRIALTHGHLTSEVRPLLAAKPDYLFSGHSHVSSDVHVESTRRINPGALYRAANFSVALLDLTRNELQFIDVPPVRLDALQNFSRLRKPKE